MKKTEKTKKSNLEADIVIIGGGGAGLSAGISAAEGGIKDIIVLEKAAVPGGNTAISHGVFAVNSTPQKRLGIDLSADDIFRDRMAYSNWNVDPRLMRLAIDRSAEMVDWLEEKGMKFNHIVGFVPENEGPRVFHKPGPAIEGAVGEPLVKTLLNECKKSGIQILCNATAKKILKGKNAITGVAAVVNGKEITISTGSVIIASGGFGGNKRMLNRYFPSHSRVFCNSLPQMTGDGIKMAGEAGAFIETQPAILIMGPHHYPWARSLGILVRRPDVMLVNKFGERYVDESMSLHCLDKSSNCLSRQPDKICYALIDSGIKRELMQGKRPVGGLEDEIGQKGLWRKELDNDLKKENREGMVKIADSWKKIAAYMRADAATLEAAVERYNSCCDNRCDADFLKEKKFLRPLRQPPFYAVLGRQGFDTTLGGIRINHNAEVLDKNSSPIKGLYAAGDTASGCESVNYNHRYPGSALSFALISGRIAAENAALYISQKR